jgi:hypothetical protein
VSGSDCDLAAPGPPKKRNCATFRPYCGSIPGTAYHHLGPFAFQISGQAVRASRRGLWDTGLLPTKPVVVIWLPVGHLIWDSGRITKQGRRELRWVLVQAARIAANTYPHWKERYQRLARCKPANKAIARKLPVVVWRVLTECVADRKADGDGTTGQWV